MSRKQVVTPELQQKFTELYQQGRSILSISRLYGVCAPCVRAALVDAGCTIRTSSPTPKLTPEQRSELEAGIRDGQSYAALAEHYGVTRERVRQIARALGAPSRSKARSEQALERRVRRQEEVRERAAAREAAREQRYQEWRHLWAQGIPLEAMAATLGITPQSLNTRLVALRKEHPEWFPRRVQRLEDHDYSLWRKLWADGLTIKAMASRLDLPHSLVAGRIPVLRKKHPEWFPYRVKR